MPIISEIPNVVILFWLSDLKPEPVCLFPSRDQEDSGIFRLAVFAICLNTTFTVCKEHSLFSCLVSLQWTSRWTRTQPTHGCSSLRTGVK